MKAERAFGQGMLLAVFFGCLSHLTWAGQFKRIQIDGQFEDWLGVPVGAEDDAEVEGSFDYRDVSLANDDEFLYIRARLHGEASYGSFHHQVLVDTDADGGTGHAWGGVGSELFIENGLSYQQKNGGFNEGAGSDLAWAVSPSGDAMQFEMRLSRASFDAEGMPFFNGDQVMVSVLARSLDWQLADSVEGVPYRFASEPEPFEGQKVLTDFEETFWFYQEVGDPEPDWLLPDYLGDDTWKGGNGFFRLGFDDGTYPQEPAVALAPGRTTYYFRTPFLWENAAEGVALLAEAHFSDGAVIYLNGDEIRRVRMPEGPVEGMTQALESAPTPGEIEVFSLPASALIVGENLLMVEMHQAPDSLESMAFGLKLTANDSVPPSLEEEHLPEDREVTEGESTVFEPGSIAGTEPYAFQWYKDGVAIDGATQRRLEIPIVLQADAGAYAVEISNGSGSVRSREAVLTTEALPVAVANEALPEDVTVEEGLPFLLSVEVTGSPELTYQWYKDGEALDLATEATFAVEEASLEDSGEYQVTVSNRVNEVISRTAVVTVQGDQEAPGVVSVRAGGTTVSVAFDELVEAVSATDPANYMIPGVNVLSAVLEADGQTVTLGTSPLSHGEVYALTVDGVADRFGNTGPVAVPFRAGIVIDGDFNDWAGIEPLAMEPMESDGTEFHQFWVTHDEDYLYLRFSFHREIGQLPVDYYYQVYVDGDDDSATGLPVSTIGSSVMIENGQGWLQVGGTFNEGSVPNTEFLLAPQASSQEFEARISLQSSKDGVPLFTGEAVGLHFTLVSTSWEVVDAGPLEGLHYALSDLPPLPDPDPPAVTASIGLERLSDGRVQLEWDGGSLESSATLRDGSWVPVAGSVSPLVVDPSDGRRFYRVNE